MAKDYIEGLNMLSNMRLCSNVPGQSIVQTALGGHQSVEDYIMPGGRIYEQREFIYKALTDIPGISAVKPKAAFYIFPKIDTKKFNIVNDEQFVLDLLREKKVLLIHGGGFNWQQPEMCIRDRFLSSCQIYYYVFKMYLYIMNSRMPRYSCCEMRVMRCV